MRKRFPGFLMILMLIPLVITVFASGGSDYRPGRKQYMENRSDLRQDSRKMGNLGKEDLRKINEERDTFFKSTEKLRLDIYLKEIELNNELGKKESDTEKALKLQKEISDFESKYNQERIKYLLNIKKVNPDLGIQFGRDGACLGGACWE